MISPFDSQGPKLGAFQATIAASDFADNACQILTPLRTGRQGSCLLLWPPVLVSSIFGARYNWHRLNRHLRGEWAHRFPLNFSESHIPDPLVSRSFMDRIPTPA
jgi:hypothetical protein